MHARAHLPTHASGWTPATILSTLGAVGPVAFVLIATALGLLDPAYDVRTQSVSELALTDHGWIQRLNFIGLGLSILAFAVALATRLLGTRAAALSLLVAGIATIGSAFATTDAPSAAPTIAGTLHNLLFLVLMVALIVAYITAARVMRQRRGWRRYARLTALLPVLVIAMLVVLIGKGSEPGDPLFGISGLLQRALLAVATGWISVTALRLIAAERQHRR